MDGWTDGVILCTDSLRGCPLSSINTGSPLHSHCFLCPDTIYNYLQVQWISHTVAPQLLSSQRRNLIHASVEMIRRVFIKPICIWLVGTVSDGLLVNCMLTCVLWSPNETPLQVLEHFQQTFGKLTFPKAKFEWKMPSRVWDRQWMSGQLGEQNMKSFYELYF